LRGAGVRAGHEHELRPRRGNLGVGIGVAGTSVGIVLCKSAVTGTLALNLPVSDENEMIGGSKSVGDGIDWLDGSQVKIEGLTLDGNARQSLLIDGAATGDIVSLTLGSGEQPLLQQNVVGATAITVGGSVSLATQPDRKFAVPQPISVPGGL
jgi:hypothetical protein